MDLERDVSSHDSGARRLLWVEEPARRPRMPDPVRSSAVRAVLVIAGTLEVTTVTVLFALAGVWLVLPAVLCAVGGTVAATWAVLDVWVTRQVWRQRHGVVSVPSSSARAVRKARRARFPGAVSPERL
ncbi:hypothetical protein [Streptomyces sp. NPDC037389]|uniref:hypothetical protein n=1 Tax=Streptomyces sp. NPDC037389 TaxID=3155369 RepID=UPI0033CB9FBD